MIFKRWKTGLGRTWALIGLGWLAAAPGWCAPDGMRDVSGHLLITEGNQVTTLDRATGILTSTVDVTLHNLGGRTLTGPLQVAVELTSNAVSVPGALGGPGEAPYNTYYYDLSPLRNGGVLAAGESASFVLRLVRPRQVAFTYHLRPWSAVKVAHPPLLRLDPLEYTVEQGATLTFDMTASDPDGEAVCLAGAPALPNGQLSVTNGPEAAGTFVFTPDDAQVGYYALTFTARDPGGLAGRRTALINVTRPNRAPTIRVPDAVTVDEGSLTTIPVVGEDPDGDALRLSAAPLPMNAVFVESPGTITFAPDYEQAGTYDITCTASDGTLISSPAVVRVTVNDVTQTPATGRLDLVVAPVESPTLASRVLVTGTVNGTTNLPPAEIIRTALITGVDPALGEQGATLDVLLAGKPTEPWATHFADGRSTAAFGAGIAVDALTVQSESSAVARIAIAADAAPGPRGIQIQSGTETAVAVPAFQVLPGQTTVLGQLSDPDTGVPITGAIVTVEGTAFRTTTQADGSFCLSGIPAGAQTLIVQAPNHEILRQPFEARIGAPAQFTNLTARATVYDPTAPGSLSVFGVLANGVADSTARRPLGELRQLVADTVILVGGTESGVLDEFGNQLNPGVNSNEYVSLRPYGVALLADKMARGETYLLGDLLSAFTFTLQWSQGEPMPLGEWMRMLQEQVNRAWTDPGHPDSRMAIVCFSRDATMAPNPPTLTPETRLSPIQAYLLGSGLWTYVFTREEAWRACPSRFWRNAWGSRANYMLAAANSVEMAYNHWIYGMTVMPLMVRLVGTASYLAEDIFTVIGMESYARCVPDAPIVEWARMETAADGTSVVRVRFHRTDGIFFALPASGYLFSLWRFDPRTDQRTAVVHADPHADPHPGLDHDGNSLLLFDPNPPSGTHFYSITETRLVSGARSLSEYELNLMKPWWEEPIQGRDYFHVAKTTKKLTSDYSEPVVITVGPSDANVRITELELDPNTDDAYYSDPRRRQLIRVSDQGTGIREVFADTQFVPPGQKGLAVDTNGSLYCVNTATESAYGGRLFRFSPPVGAREFVGTIKYFSQLLMFAHPCEAGPMVLDPDGDLYLHEQLSQQILRVPVGAAYDPNRRVGQFFAAVPANVVGKAFDMEIGPEGDLYCLYYGFQTNRVPEIVAGPSTFFSIPVYDGLGTRYPWPTANEGLITSYGITEVHLTLSLYDNLLRPLADVPVTFGADLGAVNPESTRTDADGLARTVLRLAIPPNERTGRTSLAVYADAVTDTTHHYCLDVPVVDNLERLKERYLNEIARGIVLRDGTFYDSLVAGLPAPGIVNNFLQGLYSGGSWLLGRVGLDPALVSELSERGDELGTYACGGYQSAVVYEWLTNIHWRNPHEEHWLLNGLEFGPLQAFYLGHHCGAVWPTEAGEWPGSGRSWPGCLVLDPWLSQTPAVFDYDDWNGLMLLTGAPDFSAHDNEFPCTGSAYYPGPTGHVAPPPPAEQEILLEIKPRGNWYGPADVLVAGPRGRIELTQTGPSQSRIPGAFVHHRPDHGWYIGVPAGDHDLTFTPPSTDSLDITVWLGGGRLLFTNLPARGVTGRLRLLPEDPAQPIRFDDGREEAPTFVVMPFLVDLEPAHATLDSTEDVVVSGLGTHFVAGETRVSFGPEIQVTGVQVRGPTSLVASIKVAADALPGEYVPTVASPGEWAVSAPRFAVRE